MLCGELSPPLPAGSAERGEKKKSPPEATSGSWAGLCACRGGQRGGRGQGKPSRQPRHQGDGHRLPCRSPAAPAWPAAGEEPGKGKAGAQELAKAWGSPRGKMVRNGDGGARAGVWPGGRRAARLCPARRLRGSIPSPGGDRRQQRGPWLRWTRRWLGSARRGRGPRFPGGEMAAGGPRSPAAPLLLGKRAFPQ